MNEIKISDHLVTKEQALIIRLDYISRLLGWGDIRHEQLFVDYFSKRFAFINVNTEGEGSLNHIDLDGVLKFYYLCIDHETAIKVLDRIKSDFKGEKTGSRLDWIKQKTEARVPPPKPDTKPKTGWKGVLGIYVLVIACFLMLVALLLWVEGRESGYCAVGWSIPAVTLIILFATKEDTE